MRNRFGAAEKVDQILSWLDLPEAERPRLIMSWWHGADGTGHRVGPDDPDVTKALVGQDVELARLLAELDRREAWAHTTLLIVSDHGMARVEETLGISDFVFRFCYITPLRRNNLFSKQLLDTLVFCFGPNIHSLGLFDAAFC